MSTGRRAGGALLASVTDVFFDFDSTLVAAEGLEVLAAVVASRRPEHERAELERRVHEVTDRAMAGEIPFGEALTQRLRWLAATPEDLARACDIVRSKVEPDAASTLSALRRARRRVAVVSGGLRDLVEPVAIDLGFAPREVFCNDVRHVDGRAVDVDPDNPLSRDGGKVGVIRSLAAADVSALVGDGATDLEVRLEGAVSLFVAHAGVRDRPQVTGAADAVISRLSDLLEMLEPRP